MPDLDHGALTYYAALRRVNDYVEQHLCEPISLEIAARAAGMNRTYFSTFFHAKTGMCFRDWLRARRIESALHLLRCGDHSVTDVAFAVGFQDLRSFERAFKKHTAVTPRVFKRSVRP